MGSSVSLLTTVGARLAAGQEMDTSVRDVGSLLKFYRKNKYPLLAPGFWCNGNGFTHTPDFVAARQSHAAVLRSLRAGYVAVRDRWAERGIPCIMIKSADRFLPFPYTSDNLDILIHPEHEAAAREVLLDLGYLELKNLDEPQKFLFRKFHGGETVSDIHLHSRVGWGVGFMNDQSIWARSIVSESDGMVRVPSPEDTVLITLAHAFYENKCLSLADLAKVRNSCHRALDWDYLKSVATQAGWFDGLCFSLSLCHYLEQSVFTRGLLPDNIVQAARAGLRQSPVASRYFDRLVRRGGVKLPFSVSFWFSKYLFYRKILRDGRLPLWERLYEVVRVTLRGFRLKGNIRPQGPFLVAFSGLDGAGKTRHAETLQKALDACGLRTRYYWSRCGTTGLTRLFSRLVSKARGPRQETGEKTGAEGRPSRLENPAVRLAWTFLTVLDAVIANVIHVRLPMATRGTIMICDRYIADAAAEIESSLVKASWLQRRLIDLMFALTVKPDVSVLLDVPENVSADRRQSDPESDYLTRLHRIYQELAERRGMVKKDNRTGFEDVADSIVRMVAPRYYEVYPTPLNGLFLSNPGQINRR